MDQNTGPENIPRLETKRHVLILQHPQEPDKELGSARLAHRALPNSTLKIGLSWPNLKSALGRETSPARWAVLYLGSGLLWELVKPHPGNQPTLIFVSKKGEPIGTTDLGSVADSTFDIEGFVALDGTWSQAKTLWWRNPWLLKLRRAILVPHSRSLYGKLRKEPRKECLSTIEAIAEALVATGEPRETGTELRSVFSAFLDNHRYELAGSGRSSGGFSKRKFTYSRKS